MSLVALVFEDACFYGVDFDWLNMILRSLIILVHFTLMVEKLIS